MSDPVPTVVVAEQLSNLPVQISSSGSSVTIRTGAKASGEATFRVVMSDVAGSTSPDRQVEGRISLEILGVPDVPGVPVPGKEFLDSAVSLDWRAPQSNGSPIDFYEVQDQFGHTQRCRGTSCEFTGLENGTTYRFRVRAHNAVGFSEWSGPSAGATPDDPIDLVGRIRQIDVGDGFLHIDWKPVETKGGAEVTYVVRWAGDQLPVTESEAKIVGLDNHRKYQFRVVPRNAFTIGGGLISDWMQPIGTPSTPAPPTLTDQETAGSSGAVSLTWPAVDANGPTPVRYTVYRDGTPLPACTNITTRGCDNAGLAYDGHVYSYSVLATNSNGKGVDSALGPPTQWRATGKPASWGAWTVGAHGQQQPGAGHLRRAARPAARSRPSGSTSTARRCSSWPTTGKSEATFDVPNNLGPHAVMLEVCNEEGACTQSSAQPVQTYGPLVAAHIHSITPTIDVRRISWTIEVDSNGDPRDPHHHQRQGPVGVVHRPGGGLDVHHPADGVRLPGHRERHGHAVGRLTRPRPGHGHQLGHDRAAPAAVGGGVEGSRVQRRPGGWTAALRHAASSAGRRAPTPRALSCTSR